MRDFERFCGEPCLHEAASSLEDRLEALITERPLATVGLALGLGFLIGAAWRR